MQQQISIETIALRESSMRKHAEGDALLLQQQLLEAHKIIETLKKQLDELKSEEVNGSSA